MTSKYVYSCDRCFKAFDKSKYLIKVKIATRKPIEICKECLKDVDATLKPEMASPLKEKEKERED